MTQSTMYTLPYFGQLNLSKLEEDYRTKMEVDGMSVSLDLNLDGAAPELDKLDAIRSLLEHFHKQDARNKAYIQADYSNEAAEAVKFYLTFHLEEFDQDELTDLIGAGNVEAPDQPLLDKLRIVRMGFYPNNEDFFAICDYSFGEEVTNYLVVVILNDKGELIELTVES